MSRFEQYFLITPQNKDYVDQIIILWSEYSYTGLLKEIGVTIYLSNAMFELKRLKLHRTFVFDTKIHLTLLKSRPENTILEISSISCIIKVQFRSDSFRPAVSSRVWPRSPVSRGYFNR